MTFQTKLLHSGAQPYFDVFGPLLQFLNTPEESGNKFSFMKAIIPPGVAIPLHAHPDPEALFVFEGSLEFLQFSDDNSHRWLTATGGDIISVPPNAKHALRNKSSQKVDTLLITTPNIYNFFRELEKPFDQAHPPTLPSAEDMQKLLALSRKYNYWIASPQENADVDLPGLAALQG
jgi:quercetin dioxygenase-like cupin family protein